MATFQYSAQANGSAITFNPNAGGDILNFDQTAIRPHDIFLVRDENVGGAASDDLTVAVIDGPEAGKHIFLLDIDAKSVTTTNFTFATGGSIFAGDNTSATVADDSANTHTGTVENDLFIGFGGNDNLSGGDGDDVFAFYLGADGRYGTDVISGGAGSDTLRFLDEGSVGGVVNIATGVVSGGDSDGTSGGTFTGIEHAAGTIFDDEFTGNALANLFVGREGDDTLRGLGGRDTLEGGGGSDRLNGGDGRDWADYQHAAAGIDINMVTGGADGDGGTDSLAAIEDLIGSAFGDRVIGTTGGNVLDLRGGRDDARGGVGGDTLFGGQGADTLSGNGGRDFLVGGAGNDVYVGGDGNDSLVGSGNSTFISNAEATVGRDVFLATGAGLGADLIFAFDTDTTGGLDASVDTINLVRLFNRIGYTGTDPFADGFLRVVSGGTGEGSASAQDALVQVDVNGGGDAWTTLFQVVDVSAATMLSNPDYFLFQ
jgi:Ca2+-binding RTX toxin-like protein